MNRTPEQQWLDQLRLLLDASTEGLPPEVTDRLEQMRKQTIALAKPCEDQPGDTALAAMVSRQLDASIRDLPQALTGQLGHRRHLALSRFRESASPHWAARLVDQFQNRRLLLPTGALAASFMVFMTLSLYFQGSGTTEEGEIIATELMLLASAEELELYENLDFYLWLDETGFTSEGLQ